mmetsp:Transcript_6799/g.20089  ORF Transcript_6799/g.20089 Transcript_6799/m.20089 type:complete len:343 (+) Transcript_6799:82-1110(+)
MAPAQSPAWRRQFRTQFKKTKLCRFNAAGECAYGSQCAFAHGASELEHAPDLSKTSMCAKWQAGKCFLKTQDCPYAHGVEELCLTPAFTSLRTGPSGRLSKRKPGQDDSVCDGEQEPPPRVSMPAGVWKVGLAACIPPVTAALGVVEKGADLIISDDRDHCSTRSGSVSRESASTGTASQELGRVHREGSKERLHPDLWSGAGALPPSPPPESPPPERLLAAFQRRALEQERLLAGLQHRDVEQQRPLAGQRGQACDQERRGRGAEWLDDGLRALGMCPNVLMSAVPPLERAGGRGSKCPGTAIGAPVTGQHTPSPWCIAFDKYSPAYVPLRSEDNIIRINL